jgi:hypothetical protein
MILVIRTSRGQISAVIGITAFSAYGAWLLVAPHNVIRIYTRFHSPKPLAIRIFGLLWIILVVSRSLWHIHNRSVPLPIHPDPPPASFLR